MISLNVEGVDGGDIVLRGDYIFKFGRGFVQVDDTAQLATAKGVVFAETGEWKVQHRGGSCPN